MGLRTGPQSKDATIYYDVDKTGRAFPIPYEEGVRGQPGTVGIRSPQTSRGTVTMPESGFTGSPQDAMEIARLNRFRPTEEPEGGIGPVSIYPADSPAGKQDRFAQALVRQLGVDPRFYNVNAEARKLLNEELPNLFNHVFRGRKQYGQNLTPKEQKFFDGQLRKLWDQIVRQVQDYHQYNSKRFQIQMKRFNSHLKWEEEQARAEKKAPKKTESEKELNKTLQAEFKNNLKTINLFQKNRMEGDNSLAEVAAAARRRNEEIKKQLSGMGITGLLGPGPEVEEGIQKPEKKVKTKEPSYAFSEVGGIRTIIDPATGKMTKTKLRGKPQEKNITGKIGEGVRGKIRKPPFKDAQWSEKYNSWVAKDRDGNWRIVE